MEKCDSYKVVLFYRYFQVDDVSALIHDLERECNQLELKGRILVAVEGVNGTLAGYGDNVERFINSVASLESNFGLVDWKFSRGSGNLPFADLKVCEVRELVGSGNAKQVLDENTSFCEESFGGLSKQCTGIHLTPEDFHNALLSGLRNQSCDNENCQPVVLDIRNEFEFDIGRFRGATDVGTVCYSETWKALDEVCENRVSEKVLMYCTGGIRCEKASMYLISKGVPRENIFMLQGGIHRYLQRYPDGGLFEGKNMVFDGRMAMHSTEYGDNEQELPLSGSGVNHEDTHGERDEAVVAADIVLGRCVDCAQPFDTFSRSIHCTVCRLPVLVCPTCRRNFKEYHCKRHRDLKEIYFQDLASFSAPDLTNQFKELFRLHFEAHRPTEKNRRRMLRKQLTKLELFLLENEGFDEEEKNEFRKKREELSSECDCERKAMDAQRQRQRSKKTNSQFRRLQTSNQCNDGHTGKTLNCMV